MNHKLKALVRLLQRAWFTIAGAVRKVLIPRRLLMLWGPHIVPHVDFEYTVQYLIYRQMCFRLIDSIAILGSTEDRASDWIIKPVDLVMTVFTSLIEWIAERRLNSVIAIYFGRGKDATDQKDNAYGLLELVKEAARTYDGEVVEEL